MVATEDTRDPHTFGIAAAGPAALHAVVAATRGSRLKARLANMARMCGVVERTRQCNSQLQLCDRNEAGAGSLSSVMALHCAGSFEKNLGLKVGNSRSILTRAQHITAVKKALF